MSLFQGLKNKIIGGGDTSIEGVKASLRQAQDKNDLVATAKLYYQLGEIYLQEGKSEKALLYLQRFDTLACSQDYIYKKIGDKKVEQASEWVANLEDERMYANELQERVVSMAEGLNGAQKMQWNLLTLARLESLLVRLSPIKGLELLGSFPAITDFLSGMMYQEVTQKEYQKLKQFVLDMYSLTDAEECADISNRIPIQGGEEFEAYDLAGGMVLSNLYTVVESALRILEGDLEPQDMEMDFVADSILADYYIRTSEEKLRNIPQVKKEADRIFADYEFVKSNPGQEQFVERMAQHRKIMLPEL